MVDSISYCIHENRRGVSNSVKVSYKCGLTTIKEYIQIESNGYPKHHAQNWINFRWNPKNGMPPETVDELLLKKDFLPVPEKILVDMRGQYPQIIDATFESP